MHILNPGTIKFKMKISILLPLLFTLLSCSSNPAHIRAANKISSYFNKKMIKSGYCQNLSGGAMRDDIKKFNLGFISNKVLNIEQARIEFIQALENLLSIINSDKEIRPFLHDYPFEAKNIYLSLVFKKTNGKYVDQPNISYVFLNTSKEEILYYIYDEECEKIVCYHQESYQDGLRIYNETINCSN